MWLAEKIRVLKAQLFQKKQSVFRTERLGGFRCLRGVKEIIRLLQIPDMFVHHI